MNSELATVGRASRAKAEQRALRQVTARAADEVGRLLILWGVPGAGKSTFARWLVAEKRFDHVDTDIVIGSNRASTLLERAWADVGLSAEAFVATAQAHPRPVVVEFGMYANADGMRLLNRLRGLGVEPWWFDGDRTAAKDAWLEENRKSGRAFEDGKWDEVVAVVNQNWRLIEDNLAERVLRTIESSGYHVPPAETYRRIAAIRTATD